MELCFIFQIKSSILTEDRSLNVKKSVKNIYQTDKIPLLKRKEFELHSIEKPFF